jgi:hypothetical protein
MNYRLRSMERIILISTCTFEHKRKPDLSRLWPLYDEHYSFGIDQAVL